MDKNEIYYYFNFNFNSMARRYFRRYRRGRRYSRKRYPRKRYLRGVDRNSFCIVQGGNITYTFDSNQVVGFPNKYINFAIEKLSEGGQNIDVAVGAVSSDKFVTLSRLYDQVRLTGMSVKISYVASTGLSAQTLNLVTMVDRCTAGLEMLNNKKAMTTSAVTKTAYLDKIDNAASRRKISLTGGKTVYLYYRPASIQERQFINIDVDRSTENYDDLVRLTATDNLMFNGFNPCIYSYIEKSAAAEQTQTSVVVNIEVKYYVTFKSSC